MDTPNPFPNQVNTAGNHDGELRSSSPSSSKRLVSTLDVEAELALPTKRPRTTTNTSRRVHWAPEPQSFPDTRNSEDYDHSQIWYTVRFLFQSCGAHVWGGERFVLCS
jgi:hypothetical protein